jgi:hypothetical protein
MAAAMVLDIMVILPGVFLLVMTGLAPGVHVLLV